MSKVIDLKVFTQVIIVRFVIHIFTRIELRFFYNFLLCIKFCNKMATKGLKKCSIFLERVQLRSVPVFVLHLKVLSINISTAEQKIRE